MENVKDFEIEKIGKNIILKKNKGNASEVVIPDGVTEIGSNVFSKCSSLTSIVIPSSVERIGSDAFYKCSSLTSVTFGENSSLTSIGSYVFYKCSSLTNIVIPRSVTEISDTSFNFCENLNINYYGDSNICFLDIMIKSLFAPNILYSKINSKYKYYYALGFINNYEKESVTNEKNLKNYVKYVKTNRLKFYDKLNINGLKFMTDYKIIKLEEIDELIEKSNKNNQVEMSAMLLDYKNANFSKKKIEKQLEKDLFEEKTITLSKLKILWKVKKLENGNLELSNYKGNETDIVIPYKVGNNFVEKISSLKKWGENENIISQITSIVIEDGVKEIGNEAFDSCKSLKSIEIPSSVMSIGFDAFNGCKYIVLKVESGSYAETYAKENNLKYEIV